MLTQKKCVPCEGEISALTTLQAEKLLAETDGWALAEHEGAPAISRRYNFKNFAESLEFVNKVGVIAEGEGHHPDVVFGWGYVVITLTTHAIKGLHENDFIVAAKINNL